MTPSLPHLDGSRSRLQRLWRPNAPQVLPIRATIKNVYLLPHRSGVVWGMLSLTVLLWSLNSVDNMGLLLGSFLCSACIYTLAQTAGQLLGLRVLSVNSEPVIEGTPVALRVRMKAPSKPDGILLESGNAFGCVRFDGSGMGEGVLSFPTTERGVYTWPLLRISTRRPLGVGVAWLRAWPPGEVIVWPKPESSGPSCPGHAGDQARQPQQPARPKPGQGNDEWSHLREYRPGDRWRDMDWKRVARSGTYWVRQYDQPPGGQISVDWRDTEGLSHESRIRRMARWLNEAEKQGRLSVLTLPDQSLGPDRGSSHKAACMTLLARLPREGSTQ